MKINLTERQWDILLDALQQRMNDLEDLEVTLIDKREPEPTLEEAAAYVKAQTRDQTEVMNERTTAEIMRPSIYHADCAIKIKDDGIYGNAEATLWKIRGVPKTFYPTKMAAEVAARAHFPHDNPTVRYSRISFITINFEYEENPC